MGGQNQYGSPRTPTSKQTRLERFRQDIAAAGPLTTERVEALLRRARELELADDEIGEELTALRSTLAATAMREAIARGELPVVPLPAIPQAGEICHFAASVRFGRRKADQGGHLRLTREWLTFRGALDVNVAWTEIAQARQDGRELLLWLRDSTRVLRFSFPSHEEAAAGTVIAEHLASIARDPAGVRISPLDAAL